MMQVPFVPANIQLDHKLQVSKGSVCFWTQDHCVPSQPGSGVFVE